MNTAVMGELIRLRYKLLWAKTRSRNGRIALFFAGYLLLVMLIMLLITGGFGAGMQAVRSGKAELVARVLFTTVFLQALLASLTLGFGMDSIFSDAELRRYPVMARERRMVRHVIGIADPFWLLFIILQLGVVVGLHVFGATPLFRGAFAVLLLFLCNYVMARVIGMTIDRMMQRKSGSALLMTFILAIAIVPSLVAPFLKKAPWLLKGMLNVLMVTPPFGAAAAASKHDLAGLSGLALLAGWLVGLSALLVWIERRPPVVRRVESAKMSWDSWYERLAAIFPPEDAPFVAHWLRFYTRNSRFRTMYLLTMPLLAFLVFNFSRGGGGIRYFEAGLGVFAIVGFLATSRMAVNQYGYSAGGFRRYFLLPTSPAASLRAGAYASILIGGAMIPVAIISWVAFVPLPFDARKIFMLLGSAVTGLFLFHGLGLWVSLLNPRKGDYYGNFGNDMSLGGNILLLGGVMGALLLPKLLAKIAPALIAPEHWWLVIGTVAIAAVFFSVSLRASAGMLQSRREHLLAVVEGRD